MKSRRLWATAAGTGWIGYYSPHVNQQRFIIVSWHHSCQFPPTLTNYYCYRSVPILPFPICPFLTPPLFFPSNRSLLSLHAFSFSINPATESGRSRDLVVPCKRYLYPSHDTNTRLILARKSRGRGLWYGCSPPHTLTKFLRRGGITDPCNSLYEYANAGKADGWFTWLRTGLT